MDKYRVAKLVEWAGDLRTRKRLQKVVYLLKAGGCPFDADFTLHHYGPYSHELARLTDEMARTDLLVEVAEPNPMAGQSFSYRLSDKARTQIKQLEREPARPAGAAEFERFEQLARRLLGEPIPRLEYGATVAYFRSQGRPWDQARVAAAKFKNLAPDGLPMREAERLAREVLEAGV